MTVKIVKWAVNAGDKQFTPEEDNNIIEGLSREEEARLVDGGFAEYVKKPSKKAQGKGAPEPEPASEDSDEGPVTSIAPRKK